MNGIALSPLTMIRLPFLLGFFLLLTGSAPFADALNLLSKHEKIRASTWLHLAPEPDAAQDFHTFPGHHN